VGADPKYSDGAAKSPRAQAEILLSSIVTPVNNGSGRQTSQVAVFGAYIKDVVLAFMPAKMEGVNSHDD